MRTTTLILGLISATMLLFGGCSGFVFGSCASAAEQAFEIEETAEGGTSTSEDVGIAGGFALFVAIILYVGAGLARVAHKTSLGILIVTMLMLIGLVMTDATSLFAVSYYLSIVLVGVCIVLMLLAFRRENNPELD